MSGELCPVLGVCSSIRFPFSFAASLFVFSFAILFVCLFCFPGEARREGARASGTGEGLGGQGIGASGLPITAPPVPVFGLFVCLVDY